MKNWILSFFALSFLSVGVFAQGAEASLEVPPSDFSEPPAPPPAPPAPAPEVKKPTKKAKAKARSKAKSKAKKLKKKHR